jgi:hypothetical protein
VSSARQSRNRTCFMTLATMATLCSSVLGQESKLEDAFVRQYWADARIFSFRPGDELVSYRSSPSGDVEPNGTLILGGGDKQRHFNVRIIGKLKAHRFLVNVTVEPTEEDARTKAQEINYDLSDLDPRSLEIARDEDGRVYRLSLVPRILEKTAPKQFKATDLQFECWSFPSSPVIVNDQDYIGRLAMSGGPIAWCDIPGLAKVEFSLLHLKDALPLGTLENGVIDIAHENGTTLRISYVKNGVNPEVLAGGPYRVWVRWGKPTQSIEEYRESVKQHVASLRERVKNGDLALPSGSLERLEKMSDSGRVGLIGNGVRGVEADELAKPDE